MQMVRLIIMTKQVSAKEPNFAVGVRSTRAKQRSFVEAMKGDFGFLNFEVSLRLLLFSYRTASKLGHTVTVRLMFRSTRERSYSST